MLQTTRGAKYRYIVFVNCVCTFLFYDMCEMCRQRYAGMTFIDSIGAGVHMGAVYCVELFSYDPLENPPGPCGLSRLSSLPSLSSFGREVYLSLNLSPGAPSPILSLTFWYSAVSSNRIKRQARASKTPKTQAGRIVVILIFLTLAAVFVGLGENDET